MKAISLWEPWASLIRCLGKQYETRGWHTLYRGPLLICAAKGGLPKFQVEALLSTWEFQAALGPLVGKPCDLTGKSWPGVKRENLNFGMAICVANLTECYATQSMTLKQLGTVEPRFGDFTPGRYAWKLENIRPVVPFSVKGKQGLFDVPDKLIHSHLLP
jgi:hypothetical protein